MAGVFAIRREPLLERCAGLTGTSSVLAVGIYMTVFDVTSGYSWFEGTVSEGTAWLLVLPASIIALSCASRVLKSDAPASQSTATGRPPVNRARACSRAEVPRRVGGMCRCRRRSRLRVCLSRLLQRTRRLWTSGVLEPFDDNNFSPGLTYGLLLVPSAILIVWGLLNQLRTSPSSHGLSMGSFLGLTTTVAVVFILVLEMQAVLSLGGAGPLLVRASTGSWRPDSSH